MLEQTPIVNVDAAELKPGGNAARFVSRTARLAPKIGLKTLGCSVVVVPPGKRGSPWGTAHQLVNTSESDLKYLAMSSNTLADVVLYPDSGKVGAVSGAFPKTLWHLSKLDSPVEYDEGEE